MVESMKNSIVSCSIYHQQHQTAPEPEDNLAIKTVFKLAKLFDNVIYSCAA